MAETPDPSLALLRLELLTPLAEIRGEMTELRGDVRLILQRLDQADARAADQDRELRRHDERLDALEATAVTRDELEKERSERRADRRVVVGAVLAAALALIVAGLSAALGLK